MKLELLLFTFFFSLVTFGQRSLPKNRYSATQLNDSAISFWQLGKHDTALSTISLALAHAVKNNDSLMIARCLNNTGLIYNSKGDPIKSLFYYEQSLSILKRIGNKENLPIALLNIGIAYKEQGIYDQAMQYLFEAVTNFENKNDSLKTSSAYNTIANILMIEESYDQALNYHYKALNIRKNIKYFKGIAGSLNNIGIVYKKLRKFDSASYYLRYSLALINKTSPLSEYKANTLSHIADIYKAKKKFSLALIYYDSAFIIRKAIGTKKGLSNSYFELGELNFVLKNYSIAKNYLLKGISIGKGVNAMGIVLKCYNILRQVYHESNQLNYAIIYDNLYIELSQKLLNEDKQASIIRMQIAYETEKKKQEIINLNSEKEKQATIIELNSIRLEARNTQIISLITLALALLTAIVLIYLRYRDKNRFAKKMDMVMRELHHRVNNNFQVLSSIFNLQIDYLNDDQAKSTMQSNLNRINSMILIHQSLYFDKEITKINIEKYVDQLVKSLCVAYGFSSSKIQIKWGIEKKISLVSDKAIPLGLIVNELVSNSFKYAFSSKNNQPILEINLTFNEGHYMLFIGDNGLNDKPNLHNKSFGLKIVESQVKQLKGEVESYFENGLKYKITFK